MSKEKLPAACYMPFAPHGPFFAVLVKTVVMSMERNVGNNQQSHPHQEGQTNNATPQQQGTGQRVSENKSMGMADMMNESAEQKAGAAHGQKDEGNVQQEERQP